MKAIDRLTVRGPRRPSRWDVESPIKKSQILTSCMKTWSGSSAFDQRDPRSLIEGKEFWSLGGSSRPTPHLPPPILPKLNWIRLGTIDMRMMEYAGSQIERGLLIQSPWWVTWQAKVRLPQLNSAGFPNKNSLKSSIMIEREYTVASEVGHESSSNTFLTRILNSWLRFFQSF